jgi:hypothetical protein
LEQREVSPLAKAAGPSQKHAFKTGFFYSIIQAHKKACWHWLFKSRVAKRQHFIHFIANKTYDKQNGDLSTCQGTLVAQGERNEDESIRIAPLCSANRHRRSRICLFLHLLPHFKTSHLLKCMHMRINCTDARRRHKAI